MFLTLEGIDFSGKSTQAKMLVDALSRERAVCFLREPGGTPISERIRSILLDKKNLELTDRAELLLFSASRAQLVASVIRPALAKGEIVICDRYYDSTTAYQGAGRGLPMDAVRAINAFATGGLAPDLTLFIDIPVDEIERRRAAAGKGFDRMEAAGREFFQRVRDGYCALAAAEPNRFVRIDGTQTPDDVHAGVMGAVTASPLYTVHTVS
jgi:dTMP kinase